MFAVGEIRQAPSRKFRPALGGDKMKSRLKGGKVVRANLLIYGFLTSLTLTLSPQAWAASIIKSGTGLASPDTLLTFDEIVLPENSPLTTEYGAFGVTFSGLNYDPSIYTGPWSPDGAAPFLGNLTDNDNDFTNWSVAFDTTVSEVAFTLTAAAGNQTLTALLNGATVESFSFFFGTASDNGYYGFDGIAFDAIRMSAGSGVFIDNLQFSSVIPLPTAAYLFGSGLIGLIAISRRRQTA